MITTIFFSGTLVPFGKGLMMNNSMKARVVKVNRGQYTLNMNGREICAVLSGKQKREGSLPVIGDYAEVSLSGDKAVINRVLERSSYLTRPDGSGHGDQFVKNYVKQPMAANLDYLFIVSSLNDDFSVNRILRFAATSIKGGCKPVIILTKADLCRDKAGYIEQIRKMTGAIDVFCVSSYTGEGMDELRALIKPGLTIGFMGSSGVGKSTLINTLTGSEVMKVSGIREKDGKGRHTTTHREMIYAGGTYFVDTPGMREFGLCDVEEGLNETFEDIAKLIGCCRFSDCRHESEPGCAVKRALADGSLLEERWKLYCSLMAESRRGKAMSAKKRGGLV